MQENNNTESLHDVLRQETEHKSAGTTQSETWNFDNIEEAQEITEEGEEKTDQKEGKPKQTDATIKASAETATVTMDALIDLTGGILSNIRFKNRFKDDELKTARDLADKPSEALNPDQAALVNKYNREYNKLKEKLKALPFTEDQTNRLTQAWYNYFKITGKQMSPEVFLYLGIGSVIADKALVIYAD